MMMTNSTGLASSRGALESIAIWCHRGQERGPRKRGHDRCLTENKMRRSRQKQSRLILIGLGVGMFALGCNGTSGGFGGGGDDGGDGGGGGGDVPPVFSADRILWDDIDFNNAVDLGHQAAMIPSDEQVPPGSIMLSEVAEEAGLGNSQAGGNAHGVGVGFVDLNGDGWDDIILVTGTNYPAGHYENNRDGTFTDVSNQSGIGTILDSVDGYSVAAADFDNDGDYDLYIGAMPRDILLINNGNGIFTNGTTAAGAGGPSSTQPGSASKIVSWGDYNGDGLLDIAVASSTFDQGSTGYLLQNNGNGTFTDVTTETGFGASPSGNPCAMLWSDIDADGDQDVWIWNDRGSRTGNRILLENDFTNSGKFNDITAAAGITIEAGNPMGIDTSDLDHDGLLDIYVSDIGGNELYRRKVDGSYDEIAGAAQANGEYGWGLILDDFNGDGWTDLFVAQEDDRKYLSFRNQQVSPPAFVEQQWDHGPVGSAGHNVAVAAADFDHNGTIDIVTAGTSGTRMSLFRNDTNYGSNRWLRVEVGNVPRTGGRGGISARVVVKTGELLQFRDIAGGSSRASQKSISVSFGLGQWSGAEWVAILWPDGRQKVFTHVEGNQLITF